MALLRRRATLPADVRGRLHLPRGDRAIAVAALVDGWAVATTRGLVVARDASDPERRDWSEVDGARLDPEARELTVTWVDGSPAWVLALADARSTRLPAAVHERVQSSVVHTERVTLAGGGIVRVALRRGSDGGLHTQVLGTADVDLADPRTASLVDAAEARVREAAGLS